MRAVVHVFVSFNGDLNWWEPTSPVEILNTKELNVSSCLCLTNSQLSWKIVVPLIHIDPAFCYWALDGSGGPVSPVDFKNWQCRMSLSLIYTCVAYQI